MSILHNRRRSKSGIILIIVLWIMMILTSLALSLGRNTNIELTLTKHSIASLKAKYIAWAGFIYAIDQIRLDSQDEDSKGVDTFYLCGIKKEEELTPGEIFSKKNIGEGFFDIKYNQATFDQIDSIYSVEVNEKIEKNEKVSLGQERNDFNPIKTYFGLSDEERKVNVNALIKQNAGVMSSLIVLLGYDEEVAKTIAFSVVDWKDADDQVADNMYGAEDEYYAGLQTPYLAKNAPFDSIEELLLLRGMTQEIYNSIKEYVTVYPKEGNLLINFDTATPIVLQSLARALTVYSPTVDTKDADSLVDKIIAFRNGEDGEESTSDDRVVDLSDMPVNALERNLFSQMNQYRAKVSKYLRIRVQGVEEMRGVKSNIDAIVFRDDLSVLYWNRN